MLITGGSGSGKTNALLNLIKEQSIFDKIYLYAQDPYEPKYHFLINKREITGFLMFVMLLLNIRMVRMMFIKILVNIIQVKSIKY